MNVIEAIETAARDHGPRTALVELSAESARKVGYAQLYTRVLQACSALERAGVRAGDRIAVLLDNSIDMVVSEWACLLGGYLWVALNVRSSLVELAAILADSRPTILVAGRPYAAVAARLSAAGDWRLLIAGRDGDGWDAFVSAAPVRGPRTAPGEDDPVRIRYTSGTAGRPKGAVLTRGCYDASMEAVSRVVRPVRPDDVLLQVAPMTHASGAMLLPHVVVGARALLAPGFEAGELIALVERYRVTAVFLVPTMLVRVIEQLDAEHARRLSAFLRTVVYGGASMPVDRLVRALDLLGPVFIQIYGMTESTWPVTALSRDDHRMRPGESVARWHARLASCGSPTPVGELRLVADDGREVGEGEVGEIHVRGRNTMQGYWRSAGDLKGLDADGWMHSGDLGRRDADGNITIVDRLHDMIISGGFNVYPREVEDALSTHPAVLEAAAVGKPDAEWGESIQAFVVLREGARAEPRELIDHCAAVLAGYKKPRAIEFVAALPKNPSGKVLRRELRAAKAGSD